MQSTEGLGNTFERSWQLLTGNWVLIVPGIIIGIVAALIIKILAVFGFVSVVGFTALGAGAAGLGSAFLSAVVIGLVGLAAVILTIAYTTGMAAAAWHTGTTTLADGNEALRADAAAILTAIVVLVVLAIVAAILIPFTLGLSILAFWILFLYTFASVVVGRRSGGEAVADSCRLAVRNFGMTLGVVVLLAIAFIVAGWLQHLLRVIPLLGPIAGYVLQQIVAAYAALVVVGEYIKLERPAQAVATPPRAAPPS